MSYKTKSYKKAMDGEAQLTANLKRTVLSDIALKKNYMKIKLYTIKGCHNCLIVKEYFDTMKIEYTEVDGDKNLNETLAAMKAAGTEQLPIIEYTLNISSNPDKPSESTNYTTGYSKENLDKLFKITN